MTASLGSSLSTSGSGNSSASVTGGTASTTVDLANLDPGTAYCIVALQTNDTNTQLMVAKASDMQDRNTRINLLRQLKTRLQACNPKNETGTSYKPLSPLESGQHDPSLGPREAGYYDSVKLKQALTDAGFFGVPGDTVRGPDDDHWADATFDQMNDWLNQISNQIDSLTSTTSTDSIYLQQYMNKATNAIEQASNVTKKDNDTKSAVVRNIS